MPDFFQRLAGRIAYFRAWRKTPEGKVFLEQNAIDIAVCAVLGFIFSAILTSFVFGMLQAVRLLPPTSTIPTIVFVPLAIWGGIESVLIHFGWLGRKLRPRFWIWWAITLCIIGGAVAILAGPTLTDFERLRQAMDASDALQALPATQAKAARISALIEIIKTLLFGLYLNALAFASCCVLLWRPMPAAWTPFKNFQLFLLALATLAGRHAAGLLYASLATSEDPSLEFDIVRIFLAPIVMPLFGAMILLAIALIVGTCVMILVYIFVTVPLMIFDYLEKWANNAHIRAKKKQGLYEYLFRFDFWLRHDDPPFQPDESKGARFAEEEEIEHERELDGFAFGHNDGWPLFLSTEKHILLMASTRSGKGVSVIIPHLLRYRGSAFVLDPKGENARATGRRRAALNEVVHCLDPFYISGNAPSRFNPLASFTPENMEAGSKALAAALVLNEKRDHWTASGQQLLAALILHVVTSDSYAPHEKDLVTVRRLLLGAIKPALAEMLTNEAAGGLIADLASSFLNTPENEFGSIISTAQRETEILDNPYIAASLSAYGDAPEVNFADWHSGTMTVFLCLSAPKFPVFNRWLRLVLTSALDAMTDQLDPPPQPVCFMLDELATLGHLAAIENAVGLAAGYGIQLVSVFQDIAQMKDLYRGRWASFIGNAGVRALFNIDDYDSAHYWSDFLGGHLVGTLSEAQDIYGLTKGQTAGETLRPLLTPEELMLRYARGRMLVLKQGMRPIETERVPYWKDEGLNGLWDDPRFAPDVFASTVREWPRAAE